MHIHIVEMPTIRRIPQVRAGARWRRALHIGGVVVALAVLLPLIWFAGMLALFGVLGLVALRHVGFALRRGWHRWRGTPYPVGYSGTDSATHPAMRVWSRGRWFSSMRRR